MTVWCHLPTIFNQRRALRIAGLLSLCVALTTTLLFANVSRAVPSTDRTLNFQGRLLNSSGAVVADGYYNVQFKIYQGGAGNAAGNPGGTLQWTETYINNGNASGAIQVKNGYFAANLGSVNSFGTSVDWNQSTLWLSVNVAGSSVSCTTFGSSPCTADGEMLPMKRITATPYAINSGQLEGKTADNFVQLGQGIQEDAADNTSSIFINKTGTGNLLQLQSGGSDLLTLTNSGNLEFGSGASRTINVVGAAADTDGDDLSIFAGWGGGGGSGSNGGTLFLQGGGASGTNGDGGDVVIAGGQKAGTGKGGSIYIGDPGTDTIQVGSALLSSGTQTINIGANDVAGGTQNVVIGSGGSSAGGTTTIQSKDDTTIATNGTQRARFSADSNTLYVGNADSNGQWGTASSFTIQGTSSTTLDTQGGSLTLQAGAASTGNANGGDLILNGGAGVGTGTTGLVVINTPSFQTASAQSCSSNCTVTQANVDGNGVVIVGTTESGLTVSLPDPTNITAGRIVYVTAANDSNDFSLSINGGGAGNLTSMRQNTTATMIWNGSDWTVAGASNSTTLQSAYDNTLQSAGGAEIVVSNGTNANGLTIRDSASNPVNGTLLEVQNSSAAALFSVNNAIPEYATNAGAETAGASSTTFPSNTWSAYNAYATISRHVTTGSNIASGQGSVKIDTTGFLSGASNRLSTTLTPNMTYNVSFAARLASGSFKDMTIAYASDGSSATATCDTDVSIVTSTWTKVSCSFKAPASGLTSSNGIIIGQIGGATRTFYIDNLSVTIAGDQNYATDGKVNDSGSFGTNWTTTGTGSTVTRNTSDGQEKSDSAQAVTTTGGANRGLRNKLSINPLPETLYRVSAYAKSSTSFTDFAIRYSRDGGTSYTDCVDYNTQTVSTSAWTEITCYVQTDATTASNPYVYFVQSASAARTFMVDGFSMTLATNTAPNVQIGGGANGGPTTLFTLDKGASAPIADNNDALLGSMYYDTMLGKIQCYEADGWGACGSSPDNIITISPEYTNAVMHGTGVGTMTSDFCSSSLNINDGTSGQPSICGSGQTYNLYKWTSPQTSSQTYSIYVTYQLPSTFKSFASGSTSIKARTDNGANGGAAAVQYTVMRNDGSGLTTCGNAVSVSSGTQTTWQPGLATGTADPSTCGFAAGDSVVFKIDMTASKNAIAYVSNLGFTFSNN